MRHALLAAACLAALFRTVHAETTPCTIEVATNRVAADDMLRQGEVARVILPIIHELRLIAAKAPDPKRSIADQISSRDAARFAELSQRMQQMQISTYVESGHVRDASVVERMFLAARRSYADPSYAPASNDLPSRAIILMRNAPEELEPWSPSPDTDCTVDAALAHEDMGGRERQNALLPGLKPVIKDARRLRERYGVPPGGKLDPSKMDPEDARTLETLNVEAQPAAREMTLALDLQHIRAWWAAALLVYRSRKEDVATYGDIDHIDHTLDATIDGLTEEQKGLVGVWRLIDAKVWSQARREMAQATKAAEDAQRTTNRR